ncbi:hypothetical protein HA402_013782 [Bradysia odoriphaga]|nr:hypothetical protein HA402_013782 [Bradysia odoriphaga]
MAHPTVSRYHAVFQYRPDVRSESDENAEEENESAIKKQDIEKGWYLYDLNSTHGSFVNKTRIPPKTYVRVRVGYMLKFGGSTRNFILQGPEFDEEAESDLSVTEIKELRRKKEEEYVENLKAEEKRKESEGISWGMTEDAEEETDLSINPFATTNNEELFLQDPKKTLRGYFEREGHDLDYKVDEMSPGTFLCRIELPVSDANGRPMIAEVCHKGKKKECVLQCALEACRILDRQGVLRQANHESRKRKIEHHSDSDGDDEFYDRTGDVERKKQQREAGNQRNALSYNELLEQEQQLLQNLGEINTKIDNYKKLEKKLKERSYQEDDLDEFMSTLSSETQIDKTEIRKLRFEAQRINNEHTNLKRLIKIARPVDLMPLHTETKQTDSTKKTPTLALFGKRGTFKYTSVAPEVKSRNSVLPAAHQNQSDEEEVEEMDEKEATETAHEDKNTILDNEEIDKPSTSSRLISMPSKPIEQESTAEQSEVQDKTVVPDANDEANTKKINTTGSNNSSSTSNSTKKKRNRIRIRTDKNRENVDFDEEVVDTEKYSTWLPPQGQSGDGSTDLNVKYGY